MRNDETTQEEVLLSSAKQPGRSSQQNPLSTIVIAVATVINVVVSGVQGYLNYRATLAAGDAAAAAISAANTAAGQLEVMRAGQITAELAAQTGAGQLEVMRGDQRAWLDTVDEPRISDLQMFFASSSINVSFKVHNYGRAPATNVLIEGNLIMGLRLYQREELDKIARAVCQRSSIDVSGTVIFPGSREMEIRFSALPDNVRDYVSSIQHGRELNRMTVPLLIGCLQYNILSDKKVHITPLAFSVRRAGEGQETGFDMTANQPVNPEHIALKRLYLQTSSPD